MAIRWITPVDITPAVTNNFVDVDVSAYVSATATGVFIHTDGAGGGVRIRKNGSTDNYTASAAPRWMSCGLDASKIVEIKLTTGATAKTYLVGYTESESVWFTNAVDKTIVNVGVYNDIDMSADTGADTAIAVFGAVNGYAGRLAVRKKGSVNDNYREGGSCEFVVGLDGSEIFEAKAANANTHIYINGYIKTGANAVFLDAFTDLSLGATGNWIDLATLPVDATGAFIEVYYTTTITYNYGLRKDGSTENILGNASYHVYSFVESLNRVVEGQISNTNVDFFLVGYTTTPPSTISGYKSLKGVGI